MAKQKKKPTDLANVLREAIRESGLSARKLGEQADVPQQAISVFLLGKDLRLATAAKLCEVLGYELVKKS